jgi:hypothetical protein
VSRLWERWGAALGIVAIVLWVITFVMAGDSPDPTSDSNAKIVSWYASSSHQRNQIIGALVFIVGLLCLLAFLAVLRERLIVAEGPPGRLSTLVFGSGVASAIMWLLGGVFFTAPALTASSTSAVDVLPSTFRMLQNAGYLSWVTAAAIGSVMVWAASALVLRSAVMPRWFGWFGILAGVAQLFGFFFFPLFVFWLWVLIASVLLTISAPAGAGAESMRVRETPRPNSEVSRGSPSAT